jgi:hypothetical protein
VWGAFPFGHAGAKGLYSLDNYLAKQRVGR